MSRLLWIGNAPLPDALKSDDVTSIESVEEALARVAELPVQVAVVPADDPYAADAVRALLAVKPELQVLVAATTVPARFDEVLRAGASGLLDLSANGEVLSTAIQEAWIAHERETCERELLLRLKNLNEEFLKNVIAMEKRNVELAERLEESARLASGTLSLSMDGEPVKERVLVVDDEDTICDLVKLTLAEKYDVFTVLDGETASRELTTQSFHLVLTDKNLPGMNGLDVMRAARAANADTDVIMMTGYASKESAIEAINLGASGYLEKPFELTTLSAKVDAVIAAQRDRLKKRALLAMIKERNKDFLQKYGAIRTDLESWLALRGVPLAPPVRKTGTGT